MNLLHAFAPSLEGRPDEPGLEFGDQTFSFREIDERSNQIVYLLQSLGFKSGDRLAVYLENCPEFIFLFIAAAKLGVIFVPVNILYKEREVSHILTDAAPKAVVAQGEVPGQSTVWLLSDLTREASQFPKKAFQSATTGDSIAAIVYTSGTTGASKGAMLTHNNFIANGINLVSAWQINERERFLLALPLFHVHALGNGVMIWLMTGCRMRLLERFEHQKAPAEFLSFKPTLFFGVPTIYIRLLDQESDTARQIGASLRLFVCGSAPLPAQVLDAFREKYGHTILERYGMTETLMNISNPYFGTRKAGTVGLPLPGISAKVMNEDGSPAVVGAVGEVYIKGPNVFAGYWNRADATEQAFKDGYFKTGDLGFIDADGYFTLNGRKSDLIISGGFNIYPREIEEFLLEQPGVTEAAVVGVAHPVRGEVPVAYLVVSAQVDVATLEATCRTHLASFKIPRAFVKVEKLPRTALGKVQKHLLPKPDFKG
ncbi:MAG TPA: AMP-binding protein [Cyclobacteriaceae bacterium]|nr:AMP-binding protein [Cyclobacteriaceae bacterium]